MVNNFNNQNFKIGDNLFNSQYIIDEIIGHGGDGTILTVHINKKENEKFIAKIIFKPEKIDENYWQNHSNEIITNFRISSKPNPNLVKTYDYFVTEDKSIVFIMEYIKGITLRKYLSENHLISPPIALRIFRQILNGIKQLHSYKQQIIHRDLKPENIMVNKDLSLVVIIDFGIATVITNENNTIKVLTNENDLYGTSSYIIPDLLKNRKSNNQQNVFSVQSDFYSLGVILYEMIMGQLPFEQVKDKNGKIDILKTINLPLHFDMLNISINPLIPNFLENIIYRCLACKEKEKKYRYKNIDEIINDVEKCSNLFDKEDNTPLLKPINQRFYQKNNFIDIDNFKHSQKIIFNWPIFIAISILVIIILIVSLLSIFKIF